MSNQVGLLPPQTKAEAIADLSRHPAVGGWKALACYVRPDLAEDPDEAGKWMHRALDPNTRDAWKDVHMDRVIRKGREVGYNVVWDWKCQHLGFRTSEPLASKSRLMWLLEEDCRLSDRKRQVRREIEELEQEEERGPRAVAK